MSELADMTGGGAPPSIGDFILSPLSLSAKGIVEDHLQRWHIERVSRSTTMLDLDTRTQVIAKAVSDAAYFLTLGAAAFARATQSADGQYVSLLASIRMKSPRASEPAVRQAIEDVESIDADAIAQAVDWVWGRSKKNPPPPASPPSAGTGAGGGTTPITNP